MPALLSPRTTTLGARPHAQCSRSVLRPCISALAVTLAGCQGETSSPTSSPEFSAAAPADSISPRADSISPRSVDYPNEPTGYTRLGEWAATSLYPTGGTRETSGYGIVAGTWWRYHDRMSTTTDATAPKSPPNVITYTWPAGLPPGTSPGQFEFWADSHRTEYSKLYESGWIKIPTATFEEHGPSAGLKMLGFWASGQTNAADNNLLGWTTGAGSNPVSAFTFELRQGNFVSRNLTPNIDTRALLTCGTWHQYEILMTINTVGGNNGTFEMWLDGIKTHNYTDVVYRTSTYPAKFFNRKWDATWGGAGGGNKTRSDALWIDHIYLSGVR